MNTGQYNRIISIQTLSTSVDASGDITETWGTAASVRAKVTQIDGSRYINESELIDRAVYKLELWDNSYSDNLKITYGSIVMYPIRPITRNAGVGSKLNEIVILAATKK
jgi:hypothetical protein